MAYRYRRGTRRRRGTRKAFRKAGGRYRSRAARMGRYSRRKVDRAQARALTGQSLQLKALRAAVSPPMKRLAEAEFEASSLRLGYLTFAVAHWLQPHYGIAGSAGNYSAYTNDTHHCQTTNEQFSYGDMNGVANEKVFIKARGGNTSVMALYDASNTTRGQDSRNSEILECRRPLIYEPTALLQLGAADRRTDTSGAAFNNSQYNWRENRRVGDIHLSGSFYINMRQGTPPNWVWDEEKGFENSGGDWPGNLLPSAASADGRGSMGQFIGADPFDPQYVRATCILVTDMGDGSGVTGFANPGDNRARLFAPANEQSNLRPNYTTQGGFMGAPELHRYAPTLGELYDDLEWDQSGNAMWPCYFKTAATWEPRGCSQLLLDTNKAEGTRDNYNGILTYDIMRAPIKRRKPIKNMRPGRGTITRNALHNTEVDYAILDFEGYTNEQSSTESAATPQYSVDPLQPGYAGRSFKVLYDKVIKFTPGDRGGQSGHGNARDQAEIKYHFRLPDNQYPLDGPNLKTRKINGAKWRLFWYFTASCSKRVGGFNVAINPGDNYKEDTAYSGLHEFRVSRGSEKCSWREKP